MANDFELFAGDYRVLGVDVKDPAGAPIDLSGAAAIRWQLGKEPGKPPLASKSIGAGITVTDPVAGLFDVELTNADTETLKPGDYYHEAEVIITTGRPATILSGALTIKPTLIKPPV